MSHIDVMCGSKLDLVPPFWFPGPCKCGKRYVLMSAACTIFEFSHRMSARQKVYSEWARLVEAPDACLGAQARTGLDPAARFDV